MHIAMKVYYDVTSINQITTRVCVKKYDQHQMQYSLERNFYTLSILFFTSRACVMLAIVTSFNLERFLSLL